MTIAKQDKTTQRNNTTGTSSRIILGLGSGLGPGGQGLGPGLSPGPGHVPGLGFRL